MNQHSVEKFQNYMAHHVEIEMLFVMQVKIIICGCRRTPPHPLPPSRILKVAPLSLVFVGCCTSFYIAMNANTINLAVAKMMRTWSILCIVMDIHIPQWWWHIQWMNSIARSMSEMQKRGRELKAKVNNGKCRVIPKIIRWRYDRGPPRWFSAFMSLCIFIISPEPMVWGIIMRCMTFSRQFH